MMKQVSVVVPTIGRLEGLEKCLRALGTQSYPGVRLVVVHDGPRADLVRQMANSFGAEYVEGRRNGVVQAYNQGLNASDGDITAFTDDDAVPASGWVENLVGAYSPGVGGVGGPVYGPDQDVAEPPPTTTKVMADGTFGGWQKLTGPPVKIDHLRGANMSFSKEAFERTGLFDWNYVGDGFKFESDFCLRVRKKGFGLVFNPRAVVLHTESTVRNVPRSHSPKRAYCRANNNSYFLLKNFMLGRNSAMVLKNLGRRVSKSFARAVIKGDVTYAYGTIGHVAGIARYAANTLRGNSLSSIGF